MIFDLNTALLIRDILFYWYVGYWILIGFMQDEDGEEKIGAGQYFTTTLYPIVFTLAAIYAVANSIYFNASIFLDDIKEKNKTFRKQKRKTKLAR